VVSLAPFSVADAVNAVDVRERSRMPRPELPVGEEVAVGWVPWRKSDVEREGGMQSIW
jgi:hypothetical protein